MAIAIQVAGLTTVKFQPNAGGALEDLGYSVSGVTVSKQGYFSDVPGDENGGEEGPPIDVQYFGETATIRIELSKYDETVANKIRARLDSGTAGTPGAAGTLMFADSKSVRIILSNANDPRNFPRCFVRNAIEVNRGTKFSRFIAEFEAHKNAAGVLYDASEAV